jgi:hypothetical protein
VELVPDQLLARPGDFDFLVGRWQVTNHKRRRRLAGSDAWDEIHADYEAWSHLDGALSVDEFRFHGQQPAACSVRTLDRMLGRWSIYWVTSATGTFDVPVHGGWMGDRGEFYGEDVHEGEPIDVRYLWHRLSPDSARWEQAFRPEGGDWEANWIMEFRRE